MDNPENLAIIGYTRRSQTNKNTTQYALDTIMRKQTQTT